MHAAARRGAASDGQSPYEVLGLQPGCTASDAKAAFKAKVKVFHPDVYAGDGDATAITARLNLAYQIVADEVTGGGNGNDYDDVYDADGALVDPEPFNDPKGVADRIFVNELRCAGPGCFSCCVDKMPGLFSFDPITNAARCSVTTSVARPHWEYPLYQAVAQCPRSCMHYVTPGQLKVLTEELASAVEGRADVDAVAYTLYELLAKAAYENGRDRSSKRKRGTPDAERSTRWVDWY